jgi:Berberine and berberine like
VLRASPDAHPDLFWALRGGGGNFGVVTEFEFRLHEVDPMVDLGLFFWPMDQGAEAMQLMRDVVATLGPDLNVVVGALNAPPAPFVSPEHHFAPGYVLLLTGFDRTPAHAEAVAHIRETLPPLFDMVTPMPYVALQQIDEGNAWGFRAYVTATYVEDLSDEVIDVLSEHAARKSSPMSAVLMYRLDGAFSEMAADDTAFGGGRSPRFCVFLIGFTPDPDLLVADRKWVQDLRDALRPLAVDDGYVNDLVEFEDDRVRAAYGSDKYNRLTRVKAEYDPGNLFHLNANIKPA